MSGKNVNKKIAELEKMIRELRVSARPRKVKAPQQVVAAQAVASGSGAGKKRRNRRKRADIDFSGTVRVSREELLVELVSNSAVSIELIPSEFSTLKGIANSFERAKWHSLAVFYKPGVGTTKDGLVTYGVDWDGRKPAVTRKDIAAYTPSSTHAIWADTSNRPLHLPQKMLQSRDWYVYASDADKVDKGPGTLAVKTDYASGGGELWVRYSVTLAGMRS
nr:putative capsid protein [Lasius neglectus virus 3]